MTMTNRQYTAAVNEGRFPTEPRVPLDEPFVNANGEIQNLVLENFSSGAHIHSHAGAIRANHYHKTDWHYTYVMKGEVLYFWHPIDDADHIPNPKVPRIAHFRAGEMFFTPPMVYHAMYFPSMSDIITFARNIRDHETHEEDVVRFKLVEIDHRAKQFTFPMQAP